MMGCATIKTDSTTGFMCGEDVVACCVCGTFSEHLCDYPLGNGKTCDAPLCPNHAIRIGQMPSNELRLADEEPDDDWIEFCPTHAAMHRNGDYSA